MQQPPLDRSDLRVRMKEMILRWTERESEPAIGQGGAEVDLDLLEQVVRALVQRQLAKQQDEIDDKPSKEIEPPFDPGLVDLQIRAILGRYYPQVTRKLAHHDKDEQTIDKNLLRERVRQELYRLVYKGAQLRETRKSPHPGIEISKDELEGRVREVFYQELRVLLGGTRSAREEVGVETPDIGLLDRCLRNPIPEAHSLSDEDIERILERGLGGLS
ncbi:MAG: hypothetical protein P1P76_04345 [Anaerolineales bacterium]|nr:hypothetical protein [Anaerolineales bacterium]